MVLLARRAVSGSDAALAATQRALAAGAVVAIKGIGGYHLACTVNDGTVVGAAAGTKSSRRQALRHAGP